MLLIIPVQIPLQSVFTMRREHNGNWTTIRAKPKYSKQGLISIHNK